MQNGAWNHFSSNSSSNFIHLSVEKVFEDASNKKPIYTNY